MLSSTSLVPNRSGNTFRDPYEASQEEKRSMEYMITAREKKRQSNLPIQLYRLLVLSLRFMKLTRLGGCGKVGHR